MSLWRGASSAERLKCRSVDGSDGGLLTVLLSSSITKLKLVKTAVMSPLKHRQLECNLIGLFMADFRRKHPLNDSPALNDSPSQLLCVTVCHFSLQGPCFYTWPIQRLTDDSDVDSHRSHSEPINISFIGIPLFIVLLGCFSPSSLWLRI